MTADSPGPNRPFALAPFVSNLWSYPVLACFLLVVLLSIRTISTDDLGFHLKAGQWIVQHLSFPQKDAFTYTQTNRDYLDSNGLFQILIYGFYRAFGYEALSLLKTIVILSVFILLGLRFKASPSVPWIPSLLLLAGILGMERRFIVRPEIFSWLLISLTLWILDQRYERKRNLLFLLPLVQWLWVNTEGLFLLGWAVLVIYILSGWLHEKRIDPLLLRYSLLSFALGLLNPYGIRGLLFPFVLWTRLEDSNPYKQTIAEFFSPWRALSAQNLGLDSHLNLFAFFGIAAIGLFFVLFTFRQRKLHEFLLYFIFLFLALKAVRNIPFFMLAALPILSASLADLNTAPRWGRFSKPVLLGLTLFILLWGLRVVTNAYYVDDRRNDRFGLGIDSQVLPVKAAQFLVQNKLDGRMVNDLESGGWLDWQAPQPTFMDGRLEVPEDSFYRQILQSYSPGGLIPLLAITQAELVVMEYNSSPFWAGQLAHFSDWRLVYLDECTAIYARRDYAPSIPTLSFPEFLQSKGIPDETDGSVEVQVTGSKKSKIGCWLRGFYRPQEYAMGDFSMGLFALRAKEYRTARNFFMEGFRQTTGACAEVYDNLALANLGLGNNGLGRLCLEEALRLDRGNKAANQLLKNIGGSL